MYKVFLESYSQITWPIDSIGDGRKASYSARANSRACKARAEEAGRSAPCRLPIVFTYPTLRPIQAAAGRLLIFVAVQVKLKTIEGLFGIRPYELNG